MLDARRLATLKAVIEVGSFAGAATRLSYTQAAVSQHIAELERAVGLRLVDRRPVRPTQAGLLALGAANAVDDAFAAAATGLRAIRDGEAGSLRIAAFASAVTDLLAPVLADFAKTHSDVELTLTSAEPDDAYDGLIRDRFDLAFTFDYDIDPQTPLPEIEREPLLDDPVLVALPPDHRYANRKSIGLDLLATDAWIAAPLAGLPLMALRAAAGRGFTPQVRYEGEDFAAVLALVGAGLGIALLPRLATSKGTPGVTIRPLDGAPLNRRVYTAQLRSRPVAAASAFSRLMTPLRDASG